MINQMFLSLFPIQNIEQTENKKAQRNNNLVFQKIGRECSLT